MSVAWPPLLWRMYDNVWEVWAGLPSTARWWCRPRCSLKPSELPLSGNDWGTLLLRSREKRRRWLTLLQDWPTSVWYSSSLVKLTQQEKTIMTRQMIQEALSDSWYWGLEWNEDITHHASHITHHTSHITHHTCLSRSMLLPRHCHQSLHSHGENCQHWASQRHLSQAEQDRHYHGQHLNNYYYYYESSLGTSLEIWLESWLETWWSD